MAYCVKHGEEGDTTYTLKKDNMFFDGFRVIPVCDKCGKPVVHNSISDIISTGFIYMCSSCNYKSPTNPKWLKEARAKKE